MQAVDAGSRKLPGYSHEPAFVAIERNTPGRSPRRTSLSAPVGPYPVTRVRETTSASNAQDVVDHDPVDRQLILTCPNAAEPKCPVHHAPIFGSS